MQALLFFVFTKGWFDMLLVVSVFPPDLQAGLVTAANPKQLVIALEPEAASVYCCKLQLRECMSSSHNSSPSPSTGAPKYMLSSISSECTDN